MPLKLENIIAITGLTCIILSKQTFTGHTINTSKK